MTKRNTHQPCFLPIVIGLASIIVLVFSFSAYLTSASAATLCGDGTSPDYGLTYNLRQTHWTVQDQNYVSEQTMIKVDSILDRLNEDAIVQTMILILPQYQVGNRVNCAVHFLRYMKLGEPTGERKDNGFVFLIVVEPDRIDVHYGVGLGLPALTATELTNLNRSAENLYQSTSNLDQALLTLVQGFDTVARNNYEPLISPTSLPGTNNSPQLPSTPLGILTICGQLCFGILLLLFMLWGARRGIRFNPSGFGSGRIGFPLGGGGGGSSSRGGSGSGRSGRGN